MGITPFFVESVSELQLCAIKLVTAVRIQTRVSMEFCLCSRIYFLLLCFHYIHPLYSSARVALDVVLQTRVPMESGFVLEYISFHCVCIMYSNVRVTLSFICIY